jgi:hypothetical protein
MWIGRMIRDLGYSRGLLSVEKALATKRRFDLVCFTPAKEGLLPLLVIEMKANVLKGAKSQVLGYNDEIGAPFLAVIAGERVQTFWRENGRIASVDFLPKYQELRAKL